MIFEADINGKRFEFDAPDEAAAQAAIRKLSGIGDTAMPEAPAAPQVPMYGPDGETPLTPEERDAEFAGRPEKPTGPSWYEYMMDPRAYVYDAVSKTGQALGMSESGGNRLGRDANALVDSLPPLAIEASPMGAMGETLAARGVPKAPKAPAAAKGAFGESTALYKQLYDLPMYDDTKPLVAMADDLPRRLEEARLFEDLHPDAYKTAKHMANEFRTKGASPGTLEDWRKSIKKDYLMSADERLRNQGEVLQDTLDEFVSSGEGGPVATSARSTFRKAVQVDRLELAVTKAERASSTGNKNFSGHLSTQLRQLLDKDEKAIRSGRPPQFDEKTRATLDKLARQPSGKMLDVMSTLSPDRRLGWLLQILGFGLTGGAHVGIQGALMAGGYAAKQASQAAAHRNIDKVTRGILEQ
jgi:hypothetical protein